MKTCTKCGTEKELSNFYKCKKHKDGLTYYCKNCFNIKSYNGISNKIYHKEYNKTYRKTVPGLISKIYNSQRENSKYRNHSMPTYTLKELRGWIYKQENFETLYNNWVESGYKKDLVPSIDRLDDYKGYSFDNIQLITWEENRKKVYKDMKEGRNNKRNKAVIGINIKTGEKIRFYSIKEAERQTGVPSSGIIRVCKTKGRIICECFFKRNRAGGYFWEYEK